jgi:dephospho-CoA kinase
LLGDECNRVRNPGRDERHANQRLKEEKHFQISRTIALADVTIDNHGSRADLHRRIEASPIWEWMCGAAQAARVG